MIIGTYWARQICMGFMSLGDGLKAGLPLTVAQILH